VPENVADAAAAGPQVQLAAFRQRAPAEQHWDQLAAAHPDLLADVPHVVVFADLGDRGQFYRLRAGPFAAAETAQTLCRSLKQRDVECLVVRE
jgi:cell division septation protein DedD